MVNYLEGGYYNVGLVGLVLILMFCILHFETTHPLLWYTIACQLPTLVSENLLIFQIPSSCH
jgi:hypothetical protein